MFNVKKLPTGEVHKREKCRKYGLITGHMFTLIFLCLSLLISPVKAGEKTSKEAAPVKGGTNKEKSVQTPSKRPDMSLIDAGTGKRKSVKEDAEKVLSLEDCLRLAFRIHPELYSALALKDAAGERVSLAKTGYNPSISFGTSYRRSVSSNTITSTGSFIPFQKTTKSDAYSASVSLNQNLYDFGRTHYRIVAARENLKASHYDLLTTADGIVYDIQKSYFKAVAAEKSLKVFKQAIEQRKLQLKQAKGFYNIGRWSKIEVTKAEVDLANAELNLIEAKNTAELTRASLANAIGFEGDFSYALDDTIRIDEVKLTFDEAEKFAKAQRPEILKIASTERAAVASLELTKKDYYPTVGGSASFGYSDDKPRLENKSWGWGVSLSYDIFSQGQRAHDVKQNEDQLRSTKQQKRRLVQNILLEVRTAWLNLNQAREKIVTLRKTLETARENFRLAKGRYEVGLGNNIEFGDAQLSLQQAENNLIQATLDYQIARASLEKATGLMVVSRKLLSEVNEPEK